MTQRTDWGAWSIKIMEIKTMEQEKANMAARYEHEIPEGYEARIEGNKVIIELKENEDEKIRTRLIALVEAFGQGAYKNEMLAYLEKQKDKVVKFDHDTEQKPAEWSEEDEEALRELLNILSRRELDISDDSEWLSFKLKNWRKSLRPQPSGNFAISFMNYLDEHRPDGKMCLSNGECADIETAFKKEDWAKVIRYVNKYQPHWKPSEEQLSILGKVFAGCELNTTERDSMVDLFNNLKQML